METLGYAFGKNLLTKKVSCSNRKGMKMFMAKCGTKHLMMTWKAMRLLYVAHFQPM